jgi:endonuclease-3
MPISLVQNYRVAKKGLDDRFGYGNYVAMQQAPLEDVVEALRPGGLSNVKGKVRASGLCFDQENDINLLADFCISLDQAVKKILDDLNGRVQGMSISLKDSLEHVHDLDDKDAMKELLSLHGLGPKGAACIISYQLGRDMFAIDTYVVHSSKLLSISVLAPLRSSLV